jgi:DNA-binding LacI/PurR family transcriptional regulator
MTSRKQSLLIHPTENLSVVLIERLESVIAGLPPHAALPPERALCEQFGVSRATMRTALMNLVHAGALYRHVGRGTFVAPPPPLAPEHIQIAVISPWHPETTSYYYGPILRALQASSSQKNFALRFYESADPLAVAEHETWPRGTGVLLWTIAPDHCDSLSALRATSTPFVVLSSSCADQSLPCVDSDNRGGSRQALEHLQHLGHRAIGVVLGTRRSSNHSDRVEACRELLGGHQNRWLFSCEMGEPWLPMLEVWREKRGFSALYFLDLVEAVEWLEVVRAAGVRVPDDVSIVAFDDDPLLERVGYGVTTVRQPLEAMAKRAVERLHHAVLRGEPIVGTEYFATELVVRASTRSF